MNAREERGSPQDLMLKQQEIYQDIIRLFAPEDASLQAALARARSAGVRDEMRISPVQGKLLQLLAVLCHAQRILEIGSLAGYSGIWLARALPSDGKLITLEIDPLRAQLTQSAFEIAGVDKQAQVLVGDALELLPHLLTEAPFDLIFIDADKAAYPSYLEWALKLVRPGSILVADNGIHAGKGLKHESDNDMEANGLYAYNQQVLNNSDLISLALALEDNYTDGFTISIIRPV